MNKLELPNLSEKNQINWFSSILIIAFYSEGIRKILLKYSKTWKKNKFLLIIKNYLINYKNPDKIKDLFTKFNPRIILLEMIKAFKINELVENYKIYLKKNPFSIQWNIHFISKFFSNLYINCADITFVDNKVFVNLQKNLVYKYDKKKDVLYTDFPNKKSIIHNLNKDNEYKEFAFAGNPPEILFVYKENLNDQIKNAYDSLKVAYNFELYYFRYTNDYKYDNLKEIYIFGQQYKLEAYISKQDVLFIGGIRYNNNYYLYSDINNSSIIKYNWTKFKNESVCFDNEHCVKLKKKNDFILIYTKVNYKPVGLFKEKKTKSKTPSVSLSKSINLLDYSGDSIIKDIYDIKNLSKEQIIDKLYILGDKNEKFKTLTKNDLEDIYLTKLKNIYGYLKKKENFILPKIFIKHTDWYSCMITIALYSQNIKKLLLKKSKDWDKNNIFLMIIKSFLSNYKNPDKFKDLLKKFNIHLLLFEMIKSFNIQQLIDYFKYQLKKPKSMFNFSFLSIFIINFFKYLNLNVVDLTIVNNLSFLNLQSSIDYKYNYKNDKFEVIFKSDNDLRTIDNQNYYINKNPPDILLLFYDEYDIDFKTVYDKLLKLDSRKLYKFKYDKYGLGKFNIDNIKEIEIFKNKYRLEACIDFDNDNDKFIAGIKYKNNNYIYSPTNTCEIFKYNWHKFDNTNICYDDKCKLNYTDKTKCVKIGKNENLLIFTRINYKTTGWFGQKEEIISKSLSNITPQSINHSYLSGNIMKDIYDIENLNKEELIEKITVLDNQFKFNSKLTLDKLKEIFFNKLKDVFEYKMSLKSLSNEEKEQSNEDFKSFSAYKEFKSFSNQEKEPSKGRS